MKSITRAMYIVKPNTSYLIEHLLLDLECKPKRLASHKLHVYTLDNYHFMAITEKYSTKLLRIYAPFKLVNCNSWLHFESVVT